MSRAAALALALGLTWGCTAPGQGPLPQGPERPAVTLGNPEIQAIARLLRLEDTRRFDPAVFDRLARGPEEVRRRAALAAGRIGDAAAVPVLLRLLDDDASPAVRAAAAFALGELGDTSGVVLESLRAAVPPGWVPVRAEEADIAVEVVLALSKLGTFEARAMVVQALRAAHPGTSPNARRIAAEALLGVWRFEEGPGRVNAVVRYIDSGDPELRWRAVYALMRMEEPDGARRLLERLADPDHRARANAARGLAPGVVDSAGVRDTALTALTARLSDEHPHVRILTLRRLGSYGDDRPAAAMSALLDDADPNVAIAAALALDGSADRVAEPLARVVRDESRRFAVRAAAARTLAGTAPDSVAARLDAWADGGFPARYAAARTLPAVGWPRAEPILARLADDRDPRVGVAALVAAGELAGDTTLSPADSTAVRALLTEHARGGDRRRAIVAVRALEGLVDSAALSELRLTAGIPGPDEDRSLGDRGESFYEDMVRTYVAPVLAGAERPRAEILTADGRIVVELLSEVASLTTHNFLTLAGGGFWDRGVWHRVVPNFVLQDGAPAGDPSGGPGWTIRDEINPARHARGILGMALSGPDTGGSQWYITHSPQPHLDGLGFTVFGRVVEGLDVADRVVQGDAITSIRPLQ